IIAWLNFTHSPHADLSALSLHDALPISAVAERVMRQMVFAKSSATINAPRGSTVTPTGRPRALPSSVRKPVAKSTGSPTGFPSRSEEHTSELQSRENLVCRLLLEKKKKL